ncbi:hypothetical protein GLAREA_04096 [Glarea lozoyensis ATCC 20868]|uniref:Uncharacterized protein n=1 Tax=Glarea lozoyensis (strain ATCC 20868 / MF5171) TaxID=1116229 RepID=S3D1T3_GLAL2|nr:uncharacterized protein GLAREA_04096 [Glarea lozoyensis ATCC 20868]EPE31129.1 hypothetical protein GLAREA_04096 [Glarea lozoyensis ATCC 20868]
MASPLAFSEAVISAPTVLPCSGPSDNNFPKINGITEISLGDFAGGGYCCYLDGNRPLDWLEAQKHVQINHPERFMMMQQKRTEENRTPPISVTREIVIDPVTGKHEFRYHSALLQSPVFYEFGFYRSIAHHQLWPGKTLRPKKRNSSSFVLEQKNDRTAEVERSSGMSPLDHVKGTVIHLRSIVSIIWLKLIVKDLKYETPSGDLYEVPGILISGVIEYTLPVSGHIVYCNDKGFLGGKEAHLHIASAHPEKWARCRKKCKKAFERRHITSACEVEVPQRSSDTMGTTYFKVSDGKRCSNSEFYVWVAHCQRIGADYWEELEKPEKVDEVPKDTDSSSLKTVEKDSSAQLLLLAQEENFRLRQEKESVEEKQKSLWEVVNTLNSVVSNRGRGIETMKSEKEALASQVASLQETVRSLTLANLDHNLTEFAESRHASRPRLESDEPELIDLKTQPQGSEAQIELFRKQNLRIQQMEERTMIEEQIQRDNRRFLLAKVEVLEAQTRALREKDEMTTMRLETQQTVIDVLIALEPRDELNHIKGQEIQRLKRTVIDQRRQLRAQGRDEAESDRQTPEAVVENTEELPVYGPLTLYETGEALLAEVEQDREREAESNIAAEASLASTPPDEASVADMQAITDVLFGSPSHTVTVCNDQCCEY